jgi:transposase InsO family protein
MFESSIQCALAPGPEYLVRSDQGCQYTPLAFGQRCQQAGITLSMGSVGDCDENAVTESFFATLECELLDRCRFRTPHPGALLVKPGPTAIQSWPSVAVRRCCPVA